MEEWADKNVLAHINFRVSLEGARLDYLLGSKEELQRLRHDYASLMYETKLLKYVLKDRGIDLEQEVIDRAVPKMPKSMPKMSPKGGEWDEEDDEKQAPGKNPARDDSSLSSVESEPIDPVAALRAKRLARFANM